MARRQILQCTEHLIAAAFVKRQRLEAHRIQMRAAATPPEGFLLGQIQQL